MGRSIRWTGLLVVLLAARVVGGPTASVSVEDATWVAGSTDNEVLVHVSHDSFSLLAYSVGLTYDSQKLALREVTWEGTSITSEPAYFNGVGANGEIAWGCVFTYEAPFDTLFPPSSDDTILKLVFDVIETDDATTELVFEPVVANPARPDRPIKNVLTDEGGDSVEPVLVNGTITIQSLAPHIMMIENNSGCPGEQFVVRGNFLPGPNTIVTVCGSDAAFEVQPDDSLLVTAPACNAVGFATVEVCNDFGCDSDESGFQYLGLGSPTIENVLNNEGMAGDQFMIEGVNLTDGDVSVTVCKVNATFSVQGSSLLVTAPEAPSCDPGTAVVEVSTACGTDTTEFSYQEVVDQFIRGDVNDDGGVDISDAIFQLNNLFGGGPQLICTEAGDTNDDGGSDISDPIFLLNFLFGSGAPIAPPHPACGPDPNGALCPNHQCNA